MRVPPKEDCDCEDGSASNYVYEKTKKETQCVIAMMARLHKTHLENSIDLPAQTCVYLAAARGEALRGRKTSEWYV